MSETKDIFVSVGAPSNPNQETFLCAVEDRLRNDGLTPHTVGRNTFSADAPLKAVTDLLSTCSGIVVVAFERSYFPAGMSKRGGPNEAALQDVRLPTPWNQIEAAMAYAHGLPLMVIVEAGLRNEGLLERGYDWYVQEVKLEAAALASAEFNGVFASWKRKVLQNTPAGEKNPEKSSVESPLKPQEMTVGELVGSLKPGQLWSVLGALAAVVAGAFALGAKLLGKL